MRPLHVAEVNRSGRWWAIRVPELRGVHSQSRTLEGVEPMVREAIALFLDVDEETFDVEIRLALEPEVERVVHEATLARAAALEQQQTASAKARIAVMVLRDRGLPQRDIGRLLKLSHQRIAQLLDSTSMQRRDEHLGRIASDVVEGDSIPRPTHSPASPKVAPPFG